VHPSRSQGLLNQPEKKAEESCLIDHWFRPCVDGLLWWGPGPDTKLHKVATSY